MKLHYALTDGRWIGGGTTVRDTLAETLNELRPVAASWGLPIIVTRVDNRGGRRGDRWTVTTETVTKGAA